MSHWLSPVHSASLNSQLSTLKSRLSVRPFQRRLGVDDRGVEEWNLPRLSLGEQRELGAGQQNGLSPSIYQSLSDASKCLDGGRYELACDQLIVDNPMEGLLIG